MKGAFIQIRLSHGEKNSIQKAAEFFGESVSEFIRRGALLRLKQGNNESDMDPFLVALKELTKGKPVEAVTHEEALLLAKSRRDAAAGKKGITAGEAAKIVRKEIEALKKKK